MKMKIRDLFFISLLFVSIASTPCSSSFIESTTYQDGFLQKINKYKINIPPSFAPSTKGFQTGLGSGITFKKIAPNGDLQFYCISDRGPNYTLFQSNQRRDTIIFPAPDFSPFIGLINVKPNQDATLASIQHIFLNDTLITGLPTPMILEQSRISIPTDLSFNCLSTNNNGFDTESIDIDSDGNFWVGDEYRPSLIKIDGFTGKILALYSPGLGLPDILSHCQKNRGFEALAITPNGKIYAALESILNINNETSNSANFIRLIELDPSTEITKTFAYTFDKTLYTHPKNVKIGDLAAIDNTHFLIIEQGTTPTGFRNIVYLIDISNATDISGLKLPNGQDLEYATFDKLNLNFIKKKELLNLRDYGWLEEKAEGLAIVNNHTIALTNDNDCGFSMTINNVSTERVQGYHIDYNQKKLLHYGQETLDRLSFVNDSLAQTNLWLVEFEKPLTEYFNHPNKASANN